MSRSSRTKSRVCRNRSLPAQYRITSRIPNDGSAFRHLMLALMLLAAYTAVCTASTVILFEDDFETHSVGTLPIGPGETWCMVDRYGNASDIPIIEAEAGEHGRVLRITSSGSSSRLNVGKTFDVPALQAGNSLVMMFDIRLNTARTNWFAEIVDRYFAPSGGYGCVTQNPRAPEWMLMGTGYRAGTSGDPQYPFNGVAVASMGSSDPQNPNGPRESVQYEIELQISQWYAVKVEHFGDRIELSLDGVEVAQLSNLYYDLSSPHDWMLNLGDGDSHSYSTCDISIDNVVVAFSSNLLPIHVYLWDPEYGACGSTWIQGVTWAGTDTFDYVTRISWDWGDGTVEDSWFPASHRYEHNGTYTVAVTSWGPHGDSETETVQVAVTNAVDPACSCEPNADLDSPISILHVSIIQEDEVEQIIDIAGAASLFDVTQISLAQFNAGSPPDISQYKVVVFGINDGFETDIPSLATPFNLARLSELKTYAENGGGVVWTHDTLEWGQDLGVDVETPAGVDYQEGADRSGGVAISLVEEHPIVRQPFDLKAAGDWFASEWTHTTGGVVTTALPIARFAFDDLVSDNFYLTAHEYGNGRVVVTELGHSIWQFVVNGTRWPDDLEAKLFVNGLFWAANVAAPTASFTYNPECVIVGQPVEFTDISTDDGTITSWDWSFGDSSTSNERNPSHIFKEAGSYVVVLSVSDDKNLTGQMSKQIHACELGDLSGDDLVDVVDVLMLYRFVNGVIDLDECQQARADIDQDGDVDEDDAQALADIVFGL